MMNRARQSKEKEPKEEKTNKQKHKPISAYFLPKTTTPVLEVAPPPIPTPTLSYSPKKKPSEKTIQGIF